MSRRRPREPCICREYDLNNDGGPIGVRVLLGPYWGPTGLLLGSSGVLLRAFWGPTGLQVGPYRGPIGVLLGSYWGYAGVRLGSCGAKPWCPQRNATVRHLPGLVGRPPHMAAESA